MRPNRQQELANTAEDLLLWQTKLEIRQKQVGVSPLLIIMGFCKYDFQSENQKVVTDSLQIGYAEVEKELLSTLKTTGPKLFSK